MNEDVHYLSEPPVSAELGWQQMQHLLDEHLPTKNRFPGKPLFAYCIAATFFALFIFSSLPLDTAYLKISIPELTINSFIKSTSVQQPSVAAGIREDQHVKKTPSSTITATGKNAGSPADDLSLPGTNDHSKKELLEDTPAQMADKADLALNEIEKTNSLSAKANDVEKADIARRTIRKENDTSSKWNLYGGVGVNANVAGSQNLQPYPIVTVKYKLSPQLFVTTGIASFAVTGNTINGISKTVYINDVTNNIWFYNEKTSYTRLHYIDIPLAAGVEISKHFTVKAGVQASVLIDHKTSKTVEQYDYQMNNVRTSAAVSSLAAMPVYEYKTGSNRFDYRLIGGIQYSLNKLSVGLDYQQSLHNIGSGNIVNNSKNRAIALQVLFKIK